VPGYSRRETVSGSSPGSPHAVDRGDIATGGGADGEGELVPPSLSLTLPRPHISPPPHPCLRQKDTHTLLRHPHPARAFGAPPPPPPRGQGQCLRYQGSSRAREQRWKSFPERLGVASPYPAHPQDLPMHWIVVALCHWGRRPAGRGNASPLPCLSSPPPHSRLRPASGSGPWHTRHGDGLPG